MNNSYRPGLLRYLGLYRFCIYFESIVFWLNKNWFQSILCNSQNGGDVSIGWDNHFVADPHHAQF